MSKGLSARPAGNSPIQMYDTFSTDYDHFVDWEGRLTAEMPFILQQLRAVGAKRILDVACGTGMHAIALARRGFDVVGTDASPGMIAESRNNARKAGVDVHFEVAGFGEMKRVLAVGAEHEPFDALLCLGSSLPHVVAPDQLKQTLSDFADCLTRHGVALIQNRNFDAVLAERDRWMPLQSHEEDDAEWLFVRFYDFRPDGLLAFNVVTLQRWGPGAWHQRFTSTRLWPLTRRELTGGLRVAGFEDITCYGNMEGSPFDRETSPNLVVIAGAVG